MDPGPATIALVEFARPWWLLAALATPLPIIIAAGGRRRGRKVSVFGLVCQCVALLAAAAALARPAVPLAGRAKLPALLAADVSASLRTQKRPRWSWPGPGRPERFHFAAAVAPVDTPVDEDATYVAPVLRLAWARADELAALVIRTDGRFGDADWPAAAEALAKTHLPVLIVPAEGPPPDARIVDLAATRGPEGKVELRVAVAANAHQRRRLTVTRAGRPEPLVQREMTLLADESELLTLTDSPGPGRSAVYHAELSPGDVFGENDSASALALPQLQRLATIAPTAAGRPSVPNLPADHLTAADAPTRPDGWAAYAAVCLIDETGQLLSPTQRASLADYVRAGGGLVLIGAGPYQRPTDRADPLNRVAPLAANPFHRRPLKVIVVLDASGSMAAQAINQTGRSAKQQKFAVAAEAVASLTGHMTPRDALAVITFSDEPKVVYDSGRTPPDFARLHEALAGVRPSGPTKVKPALDLALKAAPADPSVRRGLVLLLSDLMTQDKDLGPAAMAARFQAAKLSLAVAVTGGAEIDPAPTSPLAALAGRLSAELIRTDHLAGLAKVFAGFLGKARGPAIRRGGPFPVAAAGAGIFGLGPPILPAVTAYLPSAATGEAVQVLARVASGDAIIARQTIGLGRSVSIALPIGAPPPPALATAAVRWCRRSNADPRFSGRLAPRRTGRRLSMWAADDSSPMNGLQLQVRLVAARPRDAAPIELALPQTAPGRYEADLPSLENPAAAHVLDATGRLVWRTALAGRCRREFAALGPDWTTLRRLAALTSGRIVRQTALPTTAARLSSEALTRLWPFLLALAVLSMLADWSLTRPRWRRP